ncbi:hypothetical protein [Cysteiniphilum halobium]|uniref:hypothetical protein n=1 Tax=Cysteiniphilum halobium TaxID=2219059 RepID=UPI000E646E5A|nr:hypothetical protein [Cysteiniphilum halobium]
MRFFIAILFCISLQNLSYSYRYLTFTGESVLDATAFSNCHLMEVGSNPSPLNSNNVNVLKKLEMQPIYDTGSPGFYTLSATARDTSYMYSFISSSANNEYLCLIMDSNQTKLSFGGSGFYWVGSDANQTGVYTLYTYQIISFHISIDGLKSDGKSYWAHASSSSGAGDYEGFAVSKATNYNSGLPLPIPYTGNTILYSTKKHRSGAFATSDFNNVLNKLSSGAIHNSSLLNLELKSYVGALPSSSSGGYHQDVEFSVIFKPDPILSMESKFTTQVDFSSGTTVVSRGGKYAAYPVVKAQNFSTTSPPPKTVPKGYVVYYKNKFDITNRDKQLSKNIKNITLNFNFTHDELNFYKHNYVCLVTLTEILTIKGSPIETQFIAKGKKYDPTTSPQVFFKTLGGNPICENAYDCQIKTELTCHLSNMPSTITKYDSKAVSMIDLYQGVYDAEN